MRNKVTIIFTFLLFILFSAQVYASSQNEPTPSFESECEQTLQAIPSPGISFAAKLSDGKKVFVARGMGNIDAATPISSNSLFRIWSISKTMTAAVVLQLVDEDKISLEMTLDRWFPDFPLANQINIKQLLSHTSGIPNYTESTLVSERLKDVWTPVQMMDVAAKMPRKFQPGESWEYSNSNFVLLGLVIEKVTGSTLKEQLHKRIFEPLGMKKTFVWGQEDIPGGYVTGYDLDPDGKFQDVTAAMHPSVAWATGGLVSSAEDILTWAENLFEGNVLSPGMRQEMMTPVALNNGTLANYGLGLEISRTPWGVRYGHSGGPIKGYASSMTYLPAKKSMVVVLVNTANLKTGSAIFGTGWKTILYGKIN